MPFLIILGLGVLLLGASQISKNSNGLPDIDPDEQGGNFKRDFDRSFLRAAKMTGVPFAFIKAHAIAESSLNPKAKVDESNGRSDRKGWASRGLMQILWWPNSNRFAKYGHPDSELGDDGGAMFDPDLNTEIAAKLIKDNLDSVDGSVRDAINMYNTGRTEAQFKAPNGYVDKVLGYYSKLIKREVI